MVKKGLGGVSFQEEIIEMTKGATAKNHLIGNLFSTNVIKQNMQVMEQQKARQYLNGNELCLSSDAQRWMKENLDLSYKDLEDASISHTPKKVLGTSRL